MATVARLDRALLQLVGRLKRPAYEILGNPARLCGDLVEKLGPFGATTESLRLNLATLSDANLECDFGSGRFRLALDRFEVRTIGPALDWGAFGAFCVVCSDALTTVAPEVAPVSYEFDTLLWLGLDGVGFDQFVSRFVDSRLGTPRTVSFRREEEGGFPRGELLLEESSVPQSQLFMRVARRTPAATLQEALALSKDALEAELSLLELDLHASHPADLSYE